MELNSASVKSEAPTNNFLFLEEKKRKLLHARVDGKGKIASYIT